MSSTNINESKRLIQYEVIFRQVLFIFGAFMFGILAEALLHEGGHALALTMTGGSVDRITIGPLGWSFTYYATTPKYPIFTTLGGIGFGGVICLILLWFACRFRDPYWVPLGISGILALIVNGLYYIFGTVFDIGDPASLVADGLPVALVLTIGIASLILGMLLMLYFLPLIGIRPDEPFVNNCIVLGGGVSIYLLLMISYNFGSDPRNIMFWGLNAIAGLMIVVIIVACSLLLHSRIPKKYALQPTDIQWKHTIFALCLGLLPASVALLVPG